MPTWVDVHTADGKPALRYYYRYTRSIGDDEAALLIKRKHAFQQNHEHFRSLQKEHGADHVLSRFFRGAAKDAMRQYRAVCLVIGNLVSHPPKDCAFIPMRLMPCELVDELDHEFGMVESNLLRMTEGVK